MSKFDNEPSLDKIDDYNGKESKEKRNTVRLVVIGCLVLGAIFAYLKYTSLPSDYIETSTQSSITTSK